MHARSVHTSEPRQFRMLRRKGKKTFENASQRSFENNEKMLLLNRGELVSFFLKTEVVYSIHARNIHFSPLILKNEQLFPCRYP